ncbi:selenocysteine-specific elongation factor isoform X2 [Perognathus longimembris pacificus]|uniref:selenocysteine-specific elongation factor isoform X2 n=1 Tax=Perognathus longimembris pacificus TaxID=214514 RepID=UPI00201A0230|nr:selenocysteine-specific elongation factor isoform X2 [Perognathus longimembris pacificus]
MPIRCSLWKPGRLPQGPRRKFGGLVLLTLSRRWQSVCLQTVPGSGAQIIDLMMLVIDVTKGMQTQSAECLVIGQIACQKLVVVLNKVDLLAEGKRQAAIDRMTKKMQKTLENTKFQGAPILPVAAKPGGPEAPDTEAPQGISELIEVLKSQISIPQRDPSGPFLMSVDHCFSIKGQGTVMTGTVLAGSVSLGDSVEIPALKVVRKVKSMQMFHTPVTAAMQGDRLGLCVTQFDPKLLERGLVCAPDTLPTVHAALISVEKIPYFRGPLHTKAKFHITVGHETVMGRLLFFSPAPDHFDREPALDSFDFSQEYLFQEQYLCKDVAPAAAASSQVDGAGPAPEGRHPRQQWALVEFEKPVTCPRLCLVIGSRLDADIHSNSCRLAFHGVLLHGLEDRNYAESFLPALRVYKLKHKQGLVDRVMDDYNVIGRSLFKKETNIQLFVGLEVHLSTGERGVIDSAFGQSGKFKIHIPGGLSPESRKTLAPAIKKRGRAGQGEAAQPEEGPAREPQPVTIRLSFKRYIFDPQKRMVQS